MCWYFLIVYQLDLIHVIEIILSISGPLSDIRYFNFLTLCASLALFFDPDLKVTFYKIAPPNHAVLLAIILLISVVGNIRLMRELWEYQPYLNGRTNLLPRCSSKDQPTAF